MRREEFQILSWICKLHRGCWFAGIEKEEEGRKRKGVRMKENKGEREELPCVVVAGSLVKIKRMTKAR